MLFLSKCAIVATAVLALSACNPEETAQVPDPVILTLDATGHFCNMTILDHPGPKAQAFIKGSDMPFWFTSARDAIAFSMLPESARMVSVIYVTDMATVPEWEDTSKGQWIRAETAWYVIDSRMTGGMGAAEAVPFGDETAARKFATDFGGKVVGYKEVPRSYVLDANQTSGLKAETEDHAT